MPARALSGYLDVTLARGSVKGGVFSAESFREWAEFIDDVTEVDPGQARYHGGEKLTLRSRGEGLLAYFRGRYQIPGLYFLDEPEAALSPASQLELLRLLSEYRHRGHAQFVIATHSPVIMAVKGAQVFALGDGPIEETSYRADLALPAVPRLHGRSGAVHLGMNRRSPRNGEAPGRRSAAPGASAAPRLARGSYFTVTVTE